MWFFFCSITHGPACQTILPTSHDQQNLHSSKMLLWWHLLSWVPLSACCNSIETKSHLKFMHSWSKWRNIFNFQGVSHMCWAKKKVHVMWNLNGLWPQCRFVLAWFSSAYYCFFVDYHPFFDESHFQHFHISWLDLPHVHSLVQHVPTMFYRVQVWQIC